MIVRTYILSIAILLNACSQSSKTFVEMSESKTGIDFNNYLEESDELNVLNYTYFSPCFR